MRKVYEVRKFIVAKSVRGAFRLEKNFDADEIFLTKHSLDIQLDELHYKKP